MVSWGEHSQKEEHDALPVREEPDVRLALILNQEAKVSVQQQEVDGKSNLGT